MRRSNPDIEIACEVLRETPKAYLIFDGKVTVWVPKSQILDQCPPEGTPTSIFISEWLAKEKGFI